MFELRFQDYFFRKYTKLVKNNKSLDGKIERALQRLASNPKDPSLDCHRVLSAKFGSLWSCRVTGDLRIIWDYDNEELEVLDIFDIGGHEGARKVYK